MAVKNHTPGQIRYWTYILEFPDGEQWQKSIPFVHPLDYELKHTTFGKIPDLARSILSKGEASWKDQNGVGHHVRIDTEAKPVRWGKPKDALKYVKRPVIQH